MPYQNDKRWVTKNGQLISQMSFISKVIVLATLVVISFSIFVNTSSAGSIQQNKSIPIDDEYKGDRLVVLYADGRFDQIDGVPPLTVKKIHDLNTQTTVQGGKTITINKKSLTTAERKEAFDTAKPYLKKASRLAKASVINENSMKKIVIDHRTHAFALSA